MKPKFLIIIMMFVSALAMYAGADTLSVPTPEPIEQASLLPNLSANLTLQNVTLLALGFVLYFALYFRAYNTHGFSLAVWFKENWYNLFLVTPLCMAAFFLLSDTVSKWEAFALGVLPNLATDWVLKFVETRKKY